MLSDGLLLRAFSCISAGAALALCLPAPGLCVLAWFLPAALLACADSAAGRLRAFGLGWLFGTAFHAAAFYWIYLTCRFAGVSVPVSLLAWLLLSAILGLNAGLLAVLVNMQRSWPDWVRPWAWAACWVAVETVSARFGGPRPGVDVLAYTQWRHLSLLQGSSWLGPHALSFLIVLVNSAWVLLLQKRRGARVFAVCAGILLAGWWAWGRHILSGRSPVFDGPRVELLQPDIDQYRKWDASSAKDIRAAIDGLLARPRTAPADLVLWPESALPGWLGEEENSQWVRSWARRLGPMLVGSVSALGNKPRNSAVLFDGDGEAAGIYHKRTLVPFGEYVPLRRLLSPYFGILGELGDFEAGPAVQPLLATRLGPLAASICYEAVFTRWSRQDAGRGARVFANLTNDGWYKDTWGPRQHFHVNVFRAVETRATVLRAANTGISGVIDPYGVVLASAPLMSAARLDVRLPAVDPFPQGSFYSRHGDILGVLCVLAALLLSAAGLNFLEYKR
ncbi:MAG: apolipoprotein N-acyltransferase [Elusimicrobiota bacterium]|jgi:apolipoprotein N-acyltransferase